MGYVECTVYNIVDCCENDIFLYADDSTIFAPSNGAEVAVSVNKDMDNIRKWADAWMVTFEPSKCQAMILSRKRCPSSPVFFFGSTKIRLGEQMVFLGLCIDSKLQWTSHFSNICKRAG